MNDDGDGYLADFKLKWADDGSYVECVSTFNERGFRHHGVRSRVLVLTREEFLAYREALMKEQ